MDDKAAAARVSSDQEVMQKLEKVASQVEQGVKSQANSRKPPEVVLQEGDNSMPRLKGGEKWDVSTGKESAVGEKEPEIPKTNEEKDVESELNSLLKRSPSTCLSSSIVVNKSGMILTTNCSNNILQILLPLFKEGQGHL